MSDHESPQQLANTKVKTKAPWKLIFFAALSVFILLAGGCFYFLNFTESGQVISKLGSGLKGAIDAAQDGELIQLKSWRDVQLNEEQAKQVEDCQQKQMNEKGQSEELAHDLCRCVILNLPDEFLSAKDDEDSTKLMEKMKDHMRTIIKVGVACNCYVDPAQKDNEVCKKNQPGS